MVEYVQGIDPHATHPEAPELEASPETASDLQRAQLALAQQLRSYRDEYRGAMDAARAQLTQALHDAGIDIATGEG
jgi:hypothetical protein